MEPMDRDKAGEIAEEVLSREWGGGGEVSITFDGDESLRRLNREYLGRDRPTDVIAFDLSRGEDYLVGDIYISVERAAEQAEDFGVALEEELLRLELHGILHLVGYDHDGGDHLMWERQESWVRKFLGRRGSS
jgi:probable rRNA maturation factor